MRIDEEIFHKLSEENEFNVHSQSGFSHYSDMFVKYCLSTNKIAKIV